MSTREEPSAAQMDSCMQQYRLLLRWMDCKHVQAACRVLLQMSFAAHPQQDCVCPYYLDAFGEVVQQLCHELLLAQAELHGQCHVIGQGPRALPGQ